MRVIVRLLAILVLVAGLTPAELPPPSPVAALTTAEMLYLVTKFIQWPPQAPAAQAAVNPSGSGAPGSGGPGSGQFLLGIMGNDPRQRPARVKSHSRNHALVSCCSEFGAGDWTLPARQE